MQSNQMTWKSGIPGSFIKGLLITGLGAILLAGCSGGNDDPAEGGSNQPTTVLTPKGWELIWSDEFDGNALDSGKWTALVGDGTAEGIPGWGNNELQYYTADNVSLAGGDLTITARQEAIGGRDYTSARIVTKNKLDVKYGRVEASIQAPAGIGMWSAFWMLSTDSPYGGWPTGGEIDIMEVFSRTPKPFTQAAAHYGMRWPNAVFEYFKNENVDPAAGSHVHAMEWDEDRLRWFVDGVHFATLKKGTYWNYYLDPETNAHVSGGPSAPFDQPFHLLLNLAVGGNLPGDPVDSSFPGEMVVEYVRVYQCNIDPVTGKGCDGTIDLVDPNVDTAAPLSDDVFVTSYQLYGEALGPLTFPGVEETIPLEIGVFDNNGAFSISEVTSDDSKAFEINTSGGGNFNIFAADHSRQTLFGMGSASDRADYAGEIQFDLYVYSEGTDPDSSLMVKLDSGFPVIGFVDLPVADLPTDEWGTVTVQISDIVDNCCTFGGGPLELDNIFSLFVLEPTSSARLMVNNIKIKCGHPMDQGCGIAPPKAPVDTTEPFDVFIDEVAPDWDVGIVAADSGTGYADYTNGSDPLNKVQWDVVSDADSARGEVIEVSFADGDAFGVWFIQSSDAVDLGGYASGSVSFDIKVTDYGSNTTGMTMKVDCFFPCTSGDQSIGMVGNGEWETVQIPVTQLLGGGLSLANVNTGIVIFPTDQSSEQHFVLDNIRWMPGERASAEAITVFDEAVSSEWFLWDCCGGATFDVVDDDSDHGKVVELVFGEVGTVTGFQAVESVNAGALSDGRLEFEFKQVTAPPAGSVWRLKLESSGAATAKEVLLTDAGNPEPDGTWQTYSFSLSEDLAGLDFNDLKLIMIFPDWANAAGAVGRIDNLRIVPPPAAMGQVLLYDDAVAGDWYLWDCCGGATFGEETDDAEHNSVVQLSFGAGGTVTGFQSAAGVDVAAMAGSNAILRFDLKEVAPPPAGSVWRLKLESFGAATAAEVLMDSAGNPTPNNTWQSYEFSLDSDLAGLDASAINLVMFFPDWANADGAVVRLDNVRFDSAN